MLGRPLGIHRAPAIRDASFASTEKSEDGSCPWNIPINNAQMCQMNTLAKDDRMLKIEETTFTLTNLVVELKKDERPITHERRGQDEVRVDGKKTNVRTSYVVKTIRIKIEGVNPDQLMPRQANVVSIAMQGLIAIKNKIELQKVKITLKQGSIEVNAEIGTEEAPVMPEDHEVIEDIAAAIGFPERGPNLARDPMHGAGDAWRTRRHKQNLAMLKFPFVHHRVPTSNCLPGIRG